MFKLSAPDEELSEGEVDFSIETVGEMLDGYQVSVYNEKQEQVKIMQDQAPRHSSFKEREHEKESSDIWSPLKKSPKKSLSSKQKSTDNLILYAYKAVLKNCFLVVNLIFRKFCYLEDLINIWKKGIFRFVIY